MLKAKTKPKVVKPKIKKQIKTIPKYPTALLGVQTPKRAKQHHDKHVRNFPHSTGLIQTSLPPRPLYSSGGGISYTSTFESYGITNKPPYYLQSLMAKTTEPNYTQPAQAQTSSTVSGSNPMSKPDTRQFETQTKSETVNYVDLVAPKKKGDDTTQPDYITLQPLPKQPIKEKLMERAEYRKKNNIPESVKVSPMIREEKMKEKRKEFIKEKKRLRGSVAKKNEEL